MNEIATNPIERIENEIASLPPGMPSMDQLFALQDAVADSGLPQIDLDVEHFHGDGLYGRQLFIPAGTLAVGKVHKGRHLTVVLGDVSLLTSQGMKRMEGWNVLVDEPGIKRAAFAHKDTVILTVHATEKTDLHDIEDEIIVPEGRARMLLCIGGAT